MITVFNPKDIKTSDVGSFSVNKVVNEDLKEVLLQRTENDGNTNTVVIDQSNNMGVVVDVWSAGQKSHEPVLVVFDEIISVIEGSLQVYLGNATYSAKEGEMIHIPANSLVTFESSEGCRLVRVTSPPVWKALDMAWEAGIFNQI